LRTPFRASFLDSALNRFPEPNFAFLRAIHFLLRLRLAFVAAIFIGFFAPLDLFRLRGRIPFLLPVLGTCGRVLISREPSE
jgi:hypothetical protein